LSLKTIEIYGKMFSCHDCGTEHVLVFLHGFPLDHTIWNDTASFLSDRMRVIAPDLRGFGKSDIPQAKVVTMEQFAEDVLLLLHQLGVASKIVLCGLSMGGYIAMQFAKKYSERLAGLVLCDTKSAADTETAAWNRRKRADRLSDLGMTSLADAMLPNLFGNSPDEQKVSDIRKIMLRQPLQGVAAADRGMAARPDMTDLLATFEFPCLVICGEYDKISPPEEMRQIAQHIKNSSFEIIPGAGHLSPVEEPKIFAEAIKNFLTCLYEK